MLSYDMIFLENWMSLLEEQIQDKRLIDLSFYGSHDANTYTLDKNILYDYGAC